MSNTVSRPSTPAAAAGNDASAPLARRPSNLPLNFSPSLTAGLAKQPSMFASPAAAAVAAQKAADENSNSGAAPTISSLEAEVASLQRKLQTCVDTNKLQSQTMDILEKQVAVEHDRAIAAESQLASAFKDKAQLQDLLAALTERHEATLQKLGRRPSLAGDLLQAANDAGSSSSQRPAEDLAALAKQKDVAIAERDAAIKEKDGLLESLRAQLHDAKNKSSIMAARLVASVRNSQIDESGEVTFCIRMLEEERESFFRFIADLGAEVRLDTAALKALFDRQQQVGTGADSPGGAPAFVPEMVIKGTEVVNAVRGSLAEMRLTQARTLQAVTTAVPFIRDMRRHVERAARIVFNAMHAQVTVRSAAVGRAAVTTPPRGSRPSAADFVEPTPSPRHGESMASTFSIHHQAQQQQQQQQTSVGGAVGRSSFSASPYPFKDTSAGAVDGAATATAATAGSSLGGLEVGCDMLRATLHAFDDLTKILLPLCPPEQLTLHASTSNTNQNTNNTSTSSSAAAGGPLDEDPVETLIASVERDLQRHIAASNGAVRSLSNRIAKEIASHRDSVGQLRQRLSIAEAEHTTLLMSMHHASPLLIEQLEQRYALVTKQPTPQLQLLQGGGSGGNTNSSSFLVAATPLAGGQAGTTTPRAGAGGGGLEGSSTVRQAHHQSSSHAQAVTPPSTMRIATTRGGGGDGGGRSGPAAVPAGSSGDRRQQQQQRVVQSAGRSARRTMGEHAVPSDLYHYQQQQQFLMGQHHNTAGGRGRDSESDHAGDDGSEAHSSDAYNQPEDGVEDRLSGPGRRAGGGMGGGASLDYPPPPPSQQQQQQQFLIHRSTAGSSRRGGAPGGSYYKYPSAASGPGLGGGGGMLVSPSF